MRKVEDATIIYLDEADFITGKDVKDRNINTGLLPEVEREALRSCIVIYKDEILKDRYN